MMRKCHLNTCPVGIATQNKDLRARFTGDPDHVVNFFKFLAMELREIMAELGFRTIDEMVGRVDKLKMRDNITHWKQQALDLSLILHKEEQAEGQEIIKTVEQNHAIDTQIDWEFLELAKQSLADGKTKVTGSFPIENLDRSTGAIISNEISKIYKGVGLPEDTINLNFKGSAGQSFGAFSAAGLTMTVEGEANDYFGKGLSGAKLILKPHAETTYVASENIIVGNVAFYGATSGEAYMNGIGGERFCVRNSGVKAVIEGIGDHGCEYMTGGVAVILGETGRNFAAGMSGGVAYVYDKNNAFKQNCNMEMVEFDQMDVEDIETLKSLISRHNEYTGSKVAEEILANWDGELNKFVKVMPTDYKRVLLKRKVESLENNKKEVTHG
jgi:glutamate synthase (NADPH/NADH) large chain